MEQVLEREFPLPDLVAKAQATARLMKEGLLNLHKRGSRMLWSLRVWRCVRSLSPSLDSRAMNPTAAQPIIAKAAGSRINP